MLLSLLFLAATPGIVSAQKGGDKNSVAVLPFQVNAEQRFANLASELPRMIESALKAEGFAVIDKSRVDKALSDKKVEFLDLAKAREIAAAAGAGYALYGSLSIVGETVSLDARLVESTGVKPARPLFVVREGTNQINLVAKELAERAKGGAAKSETVADVQVRGLENLDKDVVLTRVKFQRGDAFDPKNVGGEVKRIFDLGYFEDVRISTEDGADGKKIYIDVVEKPRIQAIGVVGAKNIDQEDVLNAMSTKKGGVLNLKILAEDLQKIRDLYKTKGYYLTEVNYSLEQEGKGQARLNVVVQEAAKLYITDVKLEGVKEGSKWDLWREMKLGARIPLVSWLTGSGILKEELLERDSAVIETYYANKGFIDVKVGAPTVEYKEDGIHITFNINEGPRYRVGKVGFAGDLLVDEVELAKKTEMTSLSKDQDHFNREVLRADTQKLTQFYNDQGFAYAEADVKLDKQPGEIVDVVYTLQKNQKVSIRRVNVSGNDRTRDNVIRRELKLADGDLFSGAKIKKSTERLERLGFFETVDIETSPTGDPKEMDLNVKVKEKSTGQIAGGIGYGSYEGVFLSAKITEANLFGKGWFLGGSGSFSQKTTRYNVSFTNPRVFDTNIEAGSDLYYVTQRFPDFNKDTIGGGIRSAYPLGDYTKFTLGYNLAHYTLHNFQPGSIYSLLYSENQAFISSVLSTGLIRDSTDRKINPSSGSKNSLVIQTAGGFLGGDDHFNKVVADTSWYIPVPVKLLKGHIFHAHAQAGALMKGLGSDVEPPPYERFYLGGMQNLRGYPGMGVGPRDSNYQTLIGGDKEFFANLEYLFPIETEFGLQGVLFFDAGDAWGGGDHDDFSVKRSIGVGIRWYSPFGPLRLEYGYALDDIKSQGDKGRLEFSVGQFF